MADEESEANPKAQRIETGEAKTQAAALLHTLPLVFLNGGLDAG